jgi:hypothetical protein
VFFLVVFLLVVFFLDVTFLDVTFLDVTFRDVASPALADFRDVAAVARARLAGRAVVAAPLARRPAVEALRRLGEVASARLRVVRAAGAFLPVVFLAMRVSAP